jgi:predicted O-methyltransferase YrrM
MNPEERWAAVDDYVSELLARPEAGLEEALKASAAAGLPAISVSAPQGKFLQLMARAMGARRILEVGTLGGYSTIWLARALPVDGTTVAARPLPPGPLPPPRLITLEYEVKHAEVARENIRRAELASVVDLRVGRGVELLEKLVAERVEAFDFIFIDADKESYPEYLKWSLKLARVGTLIVADNVIRKGAVIDAKSNDARVQGVRKFNEMVAAEKRLSATAIQTVGSKGYDGFTMALVVS